MQDFLYAALAFAAALAILIAFHEWGHFLAARYFRIKVERFSIGFGRVLLRKRSAAGTEFVLAAIPLGGYVKMLDEREGPVLASERHLAFNLRPLYQRVTVVLAGPIFNFIFAIIAYWLTFSLGITVLIPTLGKIDEMSIAAKSGLQPGDEIVAIADQPVSSWQDVLAEVVSKIGESDTLKIAYVRGQSQPEVTYLNVQNWDNDDDPNILSSLGLTIRYPEVPAVIGEVMAGEPAAAAGLRAGDRVLAIDGRPVVDWNDLVGQIIETSDQTVRLSVLRGTETQFVDITPRQKQTDDGKTRGFLGVKVAIPEFSEDMTRHIQYGPIAAVSRAIQKTWRYSTLTLDVIRKMAFGQMSVNNISGPISIARGAGATAKSGFNEFLNFLALISISLGVLNLLPIPLLDGGHLLFYAFEGVRGRPLSERTQLASMKAGFFVLFCLMGLAFYNDLVRF